MSDLELYQQAKKDFETALANTPQEQIRKALKGYGISAMRFARRYIEPTANQELYNKIYNLVYDYFHALEKPGTQP